MMKKHLAILFFFFPWSLVAQDNIDTNTVTAAARLFDLSFDTAEKDSMLDGLKDNMVLYQKLHKEAIPNSLTYPFAFNPVPLDFVVPFKQEIVKWPVPANTVLPKNKNELAFYSIMQLASLI